MRTVTVDEPTLRGDAAWTAVPFTALGASFLVMVVIRRPGVALSLAFGAVGVLFLLVDSLTLYRHVIRRHQAVLDTSGRGGDRAPVGRGRRTVMTTHEMAAVTVERHRGRHTFTTGVSPCKRRGPIRGGDRRSSGHGR